MKCGVMYVKICPEDNQSGSWIKYCYIKSVAPKSFQLGLNNIVNYINKTYRDNIIIPMDDNLHPGIVTKSNEIYTIAKEIYEKFCILASEEGIPNSIRCVYSIGDLPDINAKSTHLLPNSELIIKLGRYLDSSEKSGIFEI
jgi:hypothetical protein